MTDNNSYVWEALDIFNTTPTEDNLFGLKRRWRRVICELKLQKLTVNDVVSQRVVDNFLKELIKLEKFSEFNELASELSFSGLVACQYFATKIQKLREKKTN